MAATEHGPGIRRNWHDLVAGLDLPLLKDTKIEAGSTVRDGQCGHLRLAHADADPIAGNARLRHFKHGGPDPIAITDAHLFVGQPVDGKILPELPIAEVASAELALPIAIGVDLVNKDGPTLAASRNAACWAVSSGRGTWPACPALSNVLTIYWEFW